MQHNRKRDTEVIDGRQKSTVMPRESIMIAPEATRPRSLGERLSVAIRANPCATNVPANWESTGVSLPARAIRHQAENLRIGGPEMGGQPISYWKRKIFRSPMILTARENP